MWYFKTEQNCFSAKIYFYACVIKGTLRAFAGKLKNRHSIDFNIVHFIIFYKSYKREKKILTLEKNSMTISLKTL